MILFTDCYIIKSRWIFFRHHIPMRTIITMMFYIHFYSFILFQFKFFRLCNFFDSFLMPLFHPIFTSNFCKTTDTYGFPIVCSFIPSISIPTMKPIIFFYFVFHYSPPIPSLHLFISFIFLFSTSQNKLLEVIVIIELYILPIHYIKTIFTIR